MLTNTVQLANLHIGGLKLLASYRFCKGKLINPGFTVDKLFTAVDPGQEIVPLHKFNSGKTSQSTSRLSILISFGFCFEKFV